MDPLDKLWDRALSEVAEESTRLRKAQIALRRLRRRLRDAKGALMVLHAALAEEVDRRGGDSRRLSTRERDDILERALQRSAEIKAGKAEGETDP